MTRKLVWIVAAGALLALPACGGGGGSDDRDEPTAVVPDSALGSVEVFSRWIGAREASESKPPLAMNAMPPPTSEADEPIEVD